MKNKRGNEFKQHWFSTAKKWIHVRIILLQETIWVLCSSSAVFLFGILILFGSGGLDDGCRGKNNYMYLGENYRYVSRTDPDMIQIFYLWMHFKGKSLLDKRFFN